MLGIDIPPSRSIQANFATTSATSSITLDDLWAQALTEYESGSRNQGLWARLFSESEGNDTLVKVNYLRIRVDEMQQLIAIEKEQRVMAQKTASQKEEAARQAELLETMLFRPREYDELPKGICPNCRKALLPLSANKCTKCSALFGDHSLFKLHEITKTEQITALRLIDIGGGKLTDYEAELLKIGEAEILMRR